MTIRVIADIDAEALADSLSTSNGSAVIISVGVYEFFNVCDCDCDDDGNDDCAIIIEALGSDVNNDGIDVIGNDECDGDDDDRRY